MGASPTPFVHQVQAGDTLLGIALRYGVELDHLLAANPEIDPRFLSVGQAIRIPGPDGAAPETILPTSTPVNLPVGAPSCYLNVSGGTVCFALVENPGQMTIEGLTGQISLLTDRGAAAASVLAYPPLNLVPPGGRMPLVAYFPESEGLGGGARVSLLSAVTAAELEGRYAPVEIVSFERVLSGGTATVEFEIVSLSEPGREARVEVLVVAYDRDGNVVGFRKWESSRPVSPRGTVSGVVIVASLGPPIEQVELLAEGRPVGAPDS